LPLLHNCKRQSTTPNPITPPPPLPLVRRHMPTAHTGSCKTCAVTRAYGNAHAPYHGVPPTSRFRDGGALKHLCDCEVHGTQSKGRTVTRRDRLEKISPQEATHTHPTTPHQTHKTTRTQTHAHRDTTQTHTDTHTQRTSIDMKYGIAADQPHAAVATKMESLVQPHSAAHHQAWVAERASDGASHRCLLACARSGPGHAAQRHATLLECAPGRHLHKRIERLSSVWLPACCMYCGAVAVRCASTSVTKAGCH
jgi:hypothetical protein